MEALNILEQKIAILVDIAKKLKVEKDALNEKQVQLCKAYDELKKENKELAADNEQLVVKFESAKNSLAKDSKQAEKQAEETKVAVDGLIDIIDSLVETEKQQ